MGAFMGTVIERVLGHESLLGVVGDPFAFWMLYNDAAKRSNGEAYVLSDAAIAATEGLRKRYVAP